MEYMALSILGHLQQATKIFKYIKANANQGWLIFDPLEYDIDWQHMRPNKVSSTERALSTR